MKIINHINNRIRKAFSDAAMQYDMMTGLHNEIGRELAKKILNVEPSQSILDVGMGTGRLTRRLSFYLPDTKVVGIDFASGMIEEARKKQAGHEIIQADANHLPFKNETFDILASNLAYQWMENIEDSFQEAYRVMSKPGNLILTIFGEKTFQELFHSLKETRGEGPLSIRKLHNMQELKNALHKAGFKDVKCDYEIIKVHFPNMMDLMRWIKDIGSNALGIEVFLGKEHIQRADEYYEDHYLDRLGIVATFEVIWVDAKK